MLRFLLRHWTSTLVVVAVLVWAVFYLPNTPSFAVFELKRAIDNRDAERAALYVDFESVVKHAGHEIVARKQANSPIGQFIGNATVDLLSGPMAQALESWTKKEVADGAKEVQIPPAGVAGAIV